MKLFVIALLTAAALAAQIRSAASADPSIANLPANLPMQPIGPDDLLILSVYDSPELSRSVRVSAQGEIRLPMLKERIRAAGLLPFALEKAIGNALVEEGILVDPIVTVSIAEYHSRPISVVGAVRNPMTFQAAGPMTLLQAIAQAGGLEKNAGSEILLTRAQMQEGALVSTTLRIPVKSLIDNSDARGNIPLQGGEEIRVPAMGQIFVVGNVKKPGAFSGPETANATVLKAVAMAEGLLPFTAKQAFIYRPDSTGANKEMAIDISQILDRKAPDLPLQPEDILYILENKRKKLSAAALERILVFGSTAGATALIYAH
ncbi:MAG: SLBB domain-containing protein [Bryobacteraceae bacterium]